MRRLEIVARGVQVIKYNKIELQARTEKKRSPERRSGTALVLSCGCISRGRGVCRSGAAVRRRLGRDVRVVQAH